MNKEINSVDNKLCQYVLVATEEETAPKYAHWVESTSRLAVGLVGLTTEEKVDDRG